MNHDHDINYPVIKGASVGIAWLWGLTWGEVASILAAIYTSILIGEWIWKKVKGLRAKKEDE